METVFNRAELDNFARYYGFHYDCCDSAVLIQDFCIAMERGLAGQSSSLPMLPTHLSPGRRFATGKKVVALDAGGTNLRAARISFDEGGRPVVEAERATRMPGSSGPLSAAEFFSAVADFCEPLFDGNGIEGIGFCFSYPMEMSPDGDGLPLAFCKEVELPELVGLPIGRGLCEELSRRRIKTPSRTVLLNDTVSTLLCGLSQIPVSFPSKFAAAGERAPQKMTAESGPAIGFILGTGFNIAYCETSIPKINFASKTEPQIVVCEAGTFSFRYRGILDIEFDAGTKNPGTFSAEKATAGAYLGPLSLHILKRAVKDGVLRFKRSAELLAMERLATKDLNILLQAPLSLEGPLGGLFDRDEAEALKTLLYIESILTERAALTAASMLAAVIEHCGKAGNPLAPVRVAVEGTTFSLYHFLGEALRARFHGIVNAQGPRFCLMEPVKQASLFGAAAAALMV